VFALYQILVVFDRRMANGDNVATTIACSFCEFDLIPEPIEQLRNNLFKCSRINAVPGPFLLEEPDEALGERRYPNKLLLGPQVILRKDWDPRCFSGRSSVKEKK